MRKPTLPYEGDARGRLPRIAAAALLFGLASAGTAHAQSIVAVVNGAPISSMDVQSRGNLMRLSGAAVSPKQVLEELVEERLKMLEARRVNLLPTDREVDLIFAGMAARSKMTPAQLTQALAGRGVNASTLKSRIRAELGWREFVRQKFRALSVVREQDVIAAVASRDKSEIANAKSVTYVVRQVIFVLPKNAPDSLVAQRKQEAQAARGRFRNCEQGFDFLKGLRDVAIKEPTNREALQLSPLLREVLEKTPVGSMTPPDKSDLGIEMVAVCERKEGTGTGALQQVMEEKLKDEQYDIQARKYLNALRVRAVIEYR
jgi:peptidyl-prolyl cis-trans isomerase SurA